MKKPLLIVAGMLVASVSTATVGKESYKYEPYHGNFSPVIVAKEELPKREVIVSVVKDFLQTHRKYRLPIKLNVESTVSQISVKTPKVTRKVTHHYIPTVASAKQYALDRLGSVQYHCIDLLFTKESHWNPLDVNHSSGAYGIPQALPGSKMATFGSDWRTNPITQVKWGIHYVNARYGSACRAWHHSQIYNWY